MRNRRAICWLLCAIILTVLAHVTLSYKGGVDKALVQRAHLLSGTVDDVQRIALARPGAAETVIARFSDWRLVEPYRSSVDRRVVMKMLDVLTVSDIEETVSDQELLRLGLTRASLGLEEPRARVAVSVADGVQEISFGTVTPTGEGVYAAVTGEDAVYVVPSNVFAAVDLSPEGFRRRSAFPVGAELVQSVDVKRGSGSFVRLVRDGEGWNMVQPKEASASAIRVRQLLAELMATSAVDFIWPNGTEGEGQTLSSALLAGYGLDPESAVTVTLKCADGTDRQIAFGKEAKDGLVYALVQNGGAVVTVNGSPKDLAQSDVSFFTDTRLFPVAAETVSRVSITDRGANYLLAKGEDGNWLLDAPVVAATDARSVAALLARIGELRPADVATEGVTISLSTNAAPVTVARDSVLKGLRLEDLRSREILDVDPVGVRRVVVSTASSKPTAVVYDKDRRAWNVESSEKVGKVSPEAVDALLDKLHPLRADWIVKLKVSSADLRAYGLETPSVTVAIDQAKEDSVRRNILIGDEAQGGRFATLGATDAVFVISQEVLNRLTEPLVTE